MSLLYSLPLVGFLIILVWQDRKEWKGFSLALWVPLLWLISSTTRLIQIFVPMGGGGAGVPSIEETISGNPVLRAVSTTLIAVGIILVLKKKNELKGLLRANRGILILYAYMLISIVWSDYPMVSIKRLIRLGGALLMAFIVASEDDHHKAFEHIFRRYAAIGLAFSIYFIKTNRAIGYAIGVHGEHFMAGIANHKNDLGILCLFALIFLSWRALRLWPSVNYFDGVLILIATYILIRARSMTALVLAMMGVAIIVGIKITKGNIKSLVIIVLVSLIVTSPILIVTMNSPSSEISGAFFSATGKDATLSGRIPMWRDLIRMGQGEILLGSGYESYWIKHYNEIWAFWNFLPTNAHNGYVEVLLNLGLLGLAIAITVVLRSLAFLGSKAYASEPYAHWFFVFIIMFIISNITEATLVKMTLGWNLFLIIYALSEKDRCSTSRALSATTDVRSLVS